MTFYCGRERRHNDQQKKHGSLCLEELDAQMHCRFHGKHVSPNYRREAARSEHGANAIGGNARTTHS